MSEEYRQHRSVRNRFERGHSQDCLEAQRFRRPTTDTRTEGTNRRRYCPLSAGKVFSVDHIFTPAFGAAQSPLNSQPCTYPRQAESTLHASPPDPIPTSLDTNGKEAQSVVWVYTGGRLSRVERTGKGTTRDIGDKIRG
ncbi:hypothetical protein L798_04167 [Zootermopsis nevadensis]|uniref:Uncharacterized protein n=1 Tax=Zootermopsis nevadensis TaxID=136037 RepID=A0A067RAG7_ZOONE|nr:hypothetical protein L798_04167 [Zootermopsis nevadensis]